MTTVALIPARSGSKGIHNKNIRKVGNRTLLERTIHTALAVDEIDHVVVSTDDLEFAEHASQAGAIVPFIRPAELATDDAPTPPVIAHAINTFEEYANIQISIIVLLEPTVPFRTACHLRTALELYRNRNCKSVISVCPLERKPENIFEKQSNSLISRYIRVPDKRYNRRQDMNHLCRLSSGVYVFGRDDFLNENEMIIDPVAYIEMSEEESINIDSEADLLLAQEIARSRNM